MSACEVLRVGHTRLLLDLGKDVGVLVEVVLLRDTISILSPSTSLRHHHHPKLTSSPTLMGLPPQPGRRTRSPAFTAGATTLPSLLGAPGPTAMTVASGSGLLVADVGRKMPLAVFCVCTPSLFSVCAATSHNAGSVPSRA